MTVEATWLISSRVARYLGSDHYHQSQHRACTVATYSVDERARGIAIFLPLARISTHNDMAVVHCCVVDVFCILECPDVVYPRAYVLLDCGRETAIQSHRTRCLIHLETGKSETARSASLVSCSGHMVPDIRS